MAAPAMVDDRARPAGEGIRAVQLALDILEALMMGGGEKGVSQIAAELGLTKGTVHRHLQTLQERGYVGQSSATGRYRLGFKAYLLGRAAPGSEDLAAVARPVMEELRDALGQTVVVSGVSGEHIVVLEVLHGTSLVEIGLRRGARYLVGNTAQGKLALAFGSRALLDRLLAKPLEPATPRSIVDPDRLVAEVELTRDRGWASAPEEAVLGINALTAPVFDRTGAFVGSVAIIGSIQFIPPEADPAQVAAVRAAAEAISERLGWTARPRG